MNKTTAKPKPSGHWSTVSSRNQVTIPADVRRAAGIKPGADISFTPLPDGRVILRQKSGDLRDLRGVLTRDQRTGEMVSSKAGKLLPASSGKPAKRK